MQIKTNGIVLHSIKHTDSSTIITVYTQHFGRVSYIVHGVNRKKSTVRASFLQPLSLVEMDVFHTPGKEIQRIKDIRMLHVFTGIPFDPVKNSLALFLAEVLFKTLRQTEADDSLFLFLENSILQMDYCEKGLANFHLVFLIKLTRYLGFYPYRDEEQSNYFDLMNGVFLNDKPHHNHFLLQEDAQHFSSIIDCDYTTMYKLSFSRLNRVKILENLMEYYRLHIPEFHGLHSLSILHSLFD